MSSIVYLTFEKPIPLEKWQKFCRENNIEYSPRTIGRNVFYFRPDKTYRDDIEISFGDETYQELPKLEDGMPDFNKASPENEAMEIMVSTVWMGNLEGVADIAKRILSKWKGKFETDPELKILMK